MDNLEDEIVSSIDPEGSYDERDWYEKNIEESVRDLVRYLRNNGVNTESSCGHKNYVQCQYILDGDILNIHGLLYRYLSERRKKVSYEIFVQIKVMNGQVYTYMNILLENTRGFLGIGEKVCDYLFTEEEKK